MPRFEVCWKMYGTALVEATCMDAAVAVALNELHDWNGAGTDLGSVSVDGTDVEP